MVKHDGRVGMMARHFRDIFNVYMLLKSLIFLFMLTILMMQKMLTDIRKCDYCTQDNLKKYFEC